MTCLRKGVVSTILCHVRRNFKEITDAFNNRKWSKSLLILPLVICSITVSAQTQKSSTIEPKQNVAAIEIDKNTIAAFAPEQSDSSFSPQTTQSPKNKILSNDVGEINKGQIFGIETSVAVNLMRMLVAVAALIFSSMLIPFIRYVHNLRSVKLSYLEFFRADIDSVMQRYQHVITRDQLVSMYPDCHPNKPWLETLISGGFGDEIPHEIVHIDVLLKRAMNEVCNDVPYFPVITYTSMPSTNTSHDNPLWKLKSEHTKVISKYLNSEVEVQETTRMLYSAPIFDWINSADKEQRMRWIRGAESLLDEIAHHYIKVRRLNDLLDELLTPSHFLGIKRFAYYPSV